MAKDFKIIIEDPERQQEFMDVFGRKELCIRSPLPQWVMLPGFNEMQEVYWLDMGELSTYEKQTLVSHLARKFEANPDDVRRALDEVGLPIRADECFVVVNNPMRWID